jgi:hypothetical protein
VPAATGYGKGSRQQNYGGDRALEFHGLAILLLVMIDHQQAVVTRKAYPKAALHLPSQPPAPVDGA